MKECICSPQGKETDGWAGVVAIVGVRYANKLYIICSFYRKRGKNGGEVEISPSQRTFRFLRFRDKVKH